MKKPTFSPYLHLEIWVAVPVIIFWSYLFWRMAFK